MRLVLIIVCSLFLSNFVQPQALKTDPSSFDSSRVSITKLSFIGGAVIAAGVAVHFARYKPLWKEHYTSFHFREDFLYAQNQDKLLHFYGGVIGSAVSAKSLSWAGVDGEDAAMYGAVTSFAFLTFMKIEDAYIDYLGFDRTDELANLLGSTYPVAQYYFPDLKSFTPKASYAGSKNKVNAKEQRIPRFLEDHEGQKFWMGITVYDLLPRNLKRYWLPVVGLAIGYAVRDLNTPQPYHETILALDLDLRKLPGDTEFLRTLWEVLNHVHLPMPAVRISPSVVWYGLYF